MRDQLKVFLVFATIYVLLGLVLIRTASADLLALDSLYVDYKNYGIVNDKNRNLLTYPEPAKEGINLGLEASLLDVFYLRPIVEGTTTDAQYRGVGLDLRLGLRVSPSVEIGYYHHSQHLLDRASATLPRYPVEDAIELKIFLYRARQGANTLF